MRMDKKRCNGCRDDFYNGKNPFDVKECWLLDKAKLIRRVAVHVDQRPPWKQKAQWTPHCYSMERYIFVAPDNSSCK